MKTNIFIPVFAAGILMWGMPAVKGGEGFGSVVVAPAECVAQEATTIMTPDVAGTTAAVVAAFAIGKAPASPATPIDRNMPGDDYNNNDGDTRNNDTDHHYYTTSGSRYGANTNAMISTVILNPVSSSGKTK